MSGIVDEIIGRGAAVGGDGAGGGDDATTVDQQHSSLVPPNTDNTVRSAGTTAANLIKDDGADDGTHIEQQPIGPTVTVKAASQSVSDMVIECKHNWTVWDLKLYLNEKHSLKPVSFFLSNATKNVYIATFLNGNVSYLWISTYVSTHMHSIQSSCLY